MEPRSRAADVLGLVPAAAIPLIFLHRRYQAHTSIGPVDIFGSDVVILVTLLAAIAAGFIFGWQRLLRTPVLWAFSGALLALIAVSCFWTPLEKTTTHLVTAAKIVEYALLAPAVVLLLRRRVDIDRFLVAFAAWCVAASAWGLLQFLGVVAEFEGKRPGQREVSFLGTHDFGAFASATLAVGFAGIALAERRRLTAASVVAGAAGAILAASVFAYAGILLAGVAAIVVGRRLGTLTARRALAIVSITAVIGVGVTALRSYDVAHFLSYFGIKQASSSTNQGVQTGSQRAMLAYIGIRIWQDHPVLGAGFERSTDRYEPYLADARQRFPDQPAQAYPSREHPWGVQNLWVQMLADLGVVGLVLGIGTIAAGLVLAFAVPPTFAFHGLVAGSWILVAVGTWNAVGIVAGIPLQAITWIGLGLAAAVAASARENESQTW